MTNLKEAGKGRVKVFIDGIPSFTIYQNDIVHAKLKLGQELSDDKIAEIKQTELFRECTEAALHFLSYRPRSEVEVRNRLQRRGFISDVVSKVINDLKQNKLIDDEAFAKFWTENRLSFKPKSKAMIELELRRKGIDTQIVEKETGDLDDEIGAYKAASKIVWKLKSLGREEFYRRLTDYLRRRGFNYDVINVTVKRLWLEHFDTSS